MKNIVKQFAIIAMLGSLAAVSGCGSANDHMRMRAQPSMQDQDDDGMMMHDRDQMRSRDRQMDGSMERSNGSCYRNNH